MESPLSSGVCSAEFHWAGADYTDKSGKVRDFSFIPVVINMFRLPDFSNKRHVCKNEEKLLERLDQAILGVIDNPEKTQQTTAIGTLF